MGTLVRFLRSGAFYGKFRFLGLQGGFLERLLFVLLLGRLTNGTESECRGIVARRFAQVFHVRGHFLIFVV